MNRAFAALTVAALLHGCAALPQESAGGFEPLPFLPGKDVVWVPTPPALVEKMLDLAGVTAADYVVDLGSGDGRNVIAAAKRGARALGVEYNPDLVALSRRKADAEGVSGKAQFVEGDMFEADLSRATVLALFLIPENLLRLKPNFMRLAPGTRIVSNGFEIPGWNVERAARADGACEVWCTAYLYIVPATVAGTWRLGAGELRFEQEFESLSGTRIAAGESMPLVNGRVKGDRIRFRVGLDEYVGRIRGGTMSGTVSGSFSGPWTASRR